MGFKKAKAAFIQRLNQLGFGTNDVRELKKLASNLARYDMVNEASGRVDGKLTQVNHGGGDLSDANWVAAERLVEAINDSELTARFREAHTAAKAKPTLRNSVSGGVGPTGVVIQVNRMDGNARW